MVSGGKDEVRWNAATQKWETVRDAAPARPVPPPVPEAPPPGPVPEHPYVTSWPPQQPPVDPEPRPARRVPLAVVLAMVVVAAAGAGGGWWLAGGGPAHPKVVASPSASRSPSDAPERTGDGKPIPSAPVSASASPGATVPAGFQLAQDPRGFRLYVPQGWTREDQGPKGVFYNSADRSRLIQVYPVAEAGLSPYDALRQTSGELANNPGYQQISLDNDASVPGVATRAARLVYAYDNQQLGHRRQVVDYAFLTPGGRHYAVLSAAPALAWPEQEQTLKTALSAFCSDTDCPTVPPG